MAATGPSGAGGCSAVTAPAVVAGSGGSFVRSMLTFWVTVAAVAVSAGRPSLRQTCRKQRLPHGAVCGDDGGGFPHLPRPQLLGVEIGEVEVLRNDLGDGDVVEREAAVEHDLRHAAIEQPGVEMRQAEMLRQPARERRSSSSLECADARPRRRRGRGSRPAGKPRRASDPLRPRLARRSRDRPRGLLSLIHISEPTRPY